MLATKVPKAKSVLYRLANAVYCVQTATNNLNKPAALECLNQTVPIALALGPKLLKYPKLIAILVYAAALVLKLIAKLRLGICSIQEIDEAYKSVSILLAKAVPQVKP